MTLLAVAAEKMEFDGVLRHARKICPQNWPVRFARSAEVGANHWLMVANGPGPRLAAKAIEAGLACGEKIDAVLSMGWCGALHPHFEVGDIFAAHVVKAGQLEYEVLLPRSSRTFLKGRLISQDRFVGSSAEKSELHVLGVQAVEMEAGAVAREASRLNLPLYCVRVISDTAGEDFYLDFNKMRDEEGRFQRARIAMEGILSPFKGLPNLIRMASRGKWTSNVLGDFLADCEF